MGWIYSEAVNESIYPEKSVFSYDENEEKIGLHWYPSLGWDNDAKGRYQCERIFGLKPGGIAYGWTCVDAAKHFGMHQYTIRIDTPGPITIWVDGQKLLEKEDGGSFIETFQVNSGKHNLLVKSVCSSRGFGFAVEVEDCSFISPCNLKGIKDEWIYIGVFNENELNPEDILKMNKIFEIEGQKTYWRVDEPNTWVRPYIESLLFAKWNYPLGVTLLGLLATGRMLSREDIIQYVSEHMGMCASMYEYAVWDSEFYGFPAINQKLVDIDMLDDCGSIGATMLEAYEDTHDQDFLHLAAVIADYIENKQERKEDGSFYRGNVGFYYENTMWADDLYMSTPFLARYYKITGMQTYLDDAAKQFLNFKKYLFMEEIKLMSHVYDFKHDIPNRIPWGRGNGWPLFSLSELLERMPLNHANRDEILRFFCEYTEGIISVQSESGLWRQVLNDPEAYEETSCTAMFIYGISKGIRLGWYKQEDVDRYYSSIKKAWNAITQQSIDSEGNVYGVCWGSRYSFTPRYYMEELQTAKNDTHGIGIVMLAGIQLIKLEQKMNNF